MRQLTLGSLFDGSGGFPLGAMLCGIQPLWASEIEPYPIRVTTKRLPFVKHYGFDRADKWDADFWRQDIIDLFRRIELLMKYQCLPYVMRFNRYTESPWRGMYITIARWCNQPSFFKKKSLREFALANGENSSAVRYLTAFEKAVPDATLYMDMKFGGEGHAG